ncbi:MAG: hypothetical protein Q7S21_01860 [archaeon]|nr:hypothetical protein [archaeon]
MQKKHIILLLGIVLIAFILVNAASAFSINETQTMNQGMKEMHGSSNMQNMHSGNGMMQMHSGSNMEQMHKQMHAGQTDEEIAQHCNSIMEESK